MRLWSSGWELGSAVNEVEWESQAGTATADSTTKRTGRNSGRLVDGGGSGTRWEKQIVSGGVAGPWFVRVYINVASFGSGYAGPNPILSLTDTGGSLTFSIRLNMDGTLELWDNLAQIGSDSSALSTGVWYRLEVRTYNNPFTLNQELEARIDGIAFASTTTSLNIDDVQYIRLGEMLGTAGTAQDIYYDDLAINDTAAGGTQISWPGPTSIVHMHPDSAGDFNQALSGDWDSVNEAVPDDGTSIATLDANNDILDVNMESTSSIGIERGSVINLVSVGIRVAGGTLSCSFQVRIKSQSGGTVSASATTAIVGAGYVTHDDATVNIYTLTSYTDPQTGKPWTTDMLDGAQIGVIAIDAAPDVLVSTLWALVDYGEKITSPIRNRLRTAIFTPGLAR